MNVTRGTLKFLAAIIWYSGFIALAFKSYTLFAEAYGLNADFFLLGLMICLALLLGVLKTKYIFIRSCKKNLKRIGNLEEPKIWQFYRIRFFIFLVSMITLGAYLSHAAHGHYWFVISVGVIDMALALALLLSSYLFWK